MRERIFPGTLDSLSSIRAHVAEAAEAAGLDSARAYNLCLAVDEIATNVVIHGYEEAGLRGNIVVESLEEPGRLVIRLLDHGAAYDPALVPEPDLSDPLNQAGGWGVYLSRIGVDQFSYTPSDSGNVHRFVVGLRDDKD